MKKFLIIMSLLSLSLVGCNNEKEVKEEVVVKTEATEPKTDAVQEAVKTEKETEVTQEANNTEEVIDEESLYAGYEKELTSQYQDKGVKAVEVAPYSKGIDIIFITASKELSKEEFSDIAKKTAEEFKSKFGFDKDLKISFSLQFQPDPKENAETLHTVIVK